MRPLLRTARRLAGEVKRTLFARPEIRAWRKACRRAEEEPRHSLGVIALAGYTIEYPDLLTLCPQWDDIFVRRTLEFRFAGEAPRILDCGANVGLASLYFKKLYPRAVITAYEADPQIHALLSRNLARNGAADVEAVNAAVWTRAGTVRFRCEGADSGAVEELGGALPGPTREVASIRLRDVIERETVDLLKIDIEGAERSVLADCAEALANVRALLLDVHEFDAVERQTGTVFDILRTAGFKFGLDNLNPLPWRPPVASPESAFPGRPLLWAVAVRAWRE